MLLVMFSSKSRPDDELREYSKNFDASIFAREGENVLILCTTTETFRRLDQLLDSSKDLAGAPGPGIFISQKLCDDQFLFL